MFTRLSLPLAMVMALSAMAGTSGIAHASPISTTTDEARARAGRLSTLPIIDRAAVSCRTVSSTDEARALAGSVRPVSTSILLVPVAQTSTDEARAFAGGAIALRIAEKAPIFASAAAPGAKQSCVTSSQ